MTRTEQTGHPILFSVICATIGTILFYRGITDFFGFGTPVRQVLGLLLFGGALSVFLMYRRLALGFWLFCLFDISVGYVSIFLLEDVWQHHVAPNLLYIAVFVPFYSDMRWLGWTDTLRALLGRKIAHRKAPPKAAVSLVSIALDILERAPWVGHAINAIPPLRRLANRLLIDGAASAALHRPLPLSLWTAEPQPITRKTKGTFGSYTSWPSLTDRAFTGRHLGHMSESEIAALPPEKAVAELFKRDKMTDCQHSTALFCFFAQWFTDSFLRTNPHDRRKNTSNHEIDLCQIYGLGQESTRMLRTLSGGKLKHRIVNGAMFPDFLVDPATLLVKAEYEGICYDPILATSFDERDPPHGRAKDLRDLLKDIGAWANTDDRWRAMYAAGLERANSTIVYSSINTIFLREHNRIADLLREENSDWSDDQLFETARNINIVLLLKIIVEDYINHLSGLPIKLSLEQGFADKKTWYRSNRIAIEFNLLYRWHSMTPNEFKIDGNQLHNEKFRFNNALVEQLGVEKILDQASRQPAGAIMLRNTPWFLQNAEEGSIAFARQFRLEAFNAYRERWGLGRYKSFLELTRGNKELASALQQLYPDSDDVRGIDRLEFVPGLFAEGRGAQAVLPPLLLRMVASDAFSQALTNPLLATYVYGPGCFTARGVDIVSSTRSFSDIVMRNLAPRAMSPHISFTRRKDL